jgi:uncharacterized circularly permuted ATP-grasp superfamily protein
MDAVAAAQSLRDAKASNTSSRWHEVFSPDGSPRPHMAKVLEDLSDLPVGDRRTLGDRMAAVLREMGVTFDLMRNDPWGREPWSCDLLPHIFASEDWALIVRGFQQRLRAFECFLADVYGKKEILRAGVVPLQAVLASPHYELPAVGLPRPGNAFLHLSGACICRSPSGQWQVKHHHFSHATGLSYMLQNRRALARVVPEIFQDASVQPLAEMPLLVMERLRETASKLGRDPTVVLLSPGTESALSSDQSFLARRMGIPVVTGGDLLVLDDCVHLKTVRGLERVEVIYNRVADAWLDPLVFRPESVLGVPGLVHCLRRGTVALVNAVGSQLADDRSLLAFAPQIIRFYLGQAPIFPPCRRTGSETSTSESSSWRISASIGFGRSTARIRVAPGSGRFPRMTRACAPRFANARVSSSRSRTMKAPRRSAFSRGDAWSTRRITSFLPRGSGTNSRSFPGPSPAFTRTPNLTANLASGGRARTRGSWAMRSLHGSSRSSSGGAPLTWVCPLAWSPAASPSPSTGWGATSSAHIINPTSFP